jgi:hypothetical protein
MYNSPEERAMIQAASGNPSVPGVVVGVGSDVPERADAERFRRKFKLRRPFALYIGRIDENKGCGELFAHFRRYAAAFPRGMDLVLVGSAIMDVPKHPRIHHLGFLDDRDKFDALAASDLLVMPSYFESLSMVALEAWALGRPVLANGRCDVLKGQCVRSNAGLYYENYEEFVEALYSLESNGPLNARLGRNGREFFQRHYAWPVIERKYLEMFAQLKKDLPPEGGSHGGGSHGGGSHGGGSHGGGSHGSDSVRSNSVASGFSRKGGMEPLPGWFARRKRDLPPAQDILARIPTGPALDVPSAADPPRGGRYPRSA